MRVMIYLCVGIGLSMAAPIEHGVLMIDPTPPPGYIPGLLLPEDIRKDLRPRDDPRIMIDPTPPPGYRPGYESRELRPVVNPGRPGQYELPNDPNIMIDPTPPPGYKPGLLLPEDNRKEFGPRDDPRIMIDPTPPPGYRPDYESRTDIPRELRPVVDPSRPGQYELPNDPNIMIDPTPPPGYKPGLLLPEDRKEIGPRDDPRIMIDPTPPPGYRPDYESRRPGQYELPNDPNIMIDPTPPPGYTPNVWDIRTDPTINPKEFEDIDKEGEHDNSSVDPEFFLLHSGFADPEELGSE